MTNDFKCNKSHSFRLQFFNSLQIPWWQHAKCLYWSMFQNFMTICHLVILYSLDLFVWVIYSIEAIKKVNWTESRIFDYHEMSLILLQLPLVISFILKPYWYGFLFTYFKSLKRLSNGSPTIRLSRNILYCGNLQKWATLIVVEYSMKVMHW